MDNAIANALKEKKELEARLAKVNQFLALYDEFSGTKSENVGSVKVRMDPARAADPRDLFPFTLQVVPARKCTPAELVELAASAMKDLGTPLTRGELVEALEDRGAILPGESKEEKGRYVGTIMWRRDDVFENVEGRGYWLKGVPIPQNEAEQRELRLSDRPI